MTTADTLNVLGFIVGGVGSSLGIFGIFQQTNAYYTFKPFKLTAFLNHVFRVGRTYVLEGKSAALELLSVTAKLAEKRGEDRSQSLIGLYWVFLGFFLQLAGSFLLLLQSLL